MHFFVCVFCFFWVWNSLMCVANTAVIMGRGRGARVGLSLIRPIKSVSHLVYKQSHQSGGWYCYANTSWLLYVERLWGEFRQSTCWPELSKGKWNLQSFVWPTKEELCSVFVYLCFRSSHICLMSTLVRGCWRESTPTYSIRWAPGQSTTSGRGSVFTDSPYD